VPNYRITDPATGQTVTVSAATPEDARAKATGALRPANTSANRERLEGFARPVAGFADMAMMASPSHQAANALRGALGMRQPPSLASATEGISEAGEANPTPLYTFWRGIGTGAVGVGTLAMTGGLSAPLAGASMAGGLIGSEVQTATGSGLAGAAADAATTALLGNPSGAMRLAGKLKLGGGTVDDVSNAVTAKFASARNAARSAFARIPDSVSGTADATRVRDLARKLVDINAPEDVPAVVRRVAAWGDEIEFNKLRRTVSSLSAMRAAAGETSKQGRQAATAMKLSDEIDGLLTQFEKGSSEASTAAQAFRQARTAWASFRSQFPSQGAFAHAVLNPKTARENPEDALKFIFSHRDRVSETRLLANAVAGDAVAEEGLRRGYLQFLAENPDQTGFGSVLQRFNKTRDVAVNLFGKKAADSLYKNLRRAQSRGGDIGNHPFLLVMSVGGASALAGMTGSKLAGAVAVGSGSYWIAKHMTARNAQRVFIESAFDDDLRRLLAQRVTRPAAADTIARVSALLARRGVNLEEDGESQ
jgi:hypothetical protein